MTVSAPRPDDPTAVRAAYDAVAADYARLLPDTRAEQPLELAMVDTFVTAIGQGPALDAGCGAGRMSRHLAGRGVVVEGVDLSPGMLEQARKAQPGVRFTEAPLTDLPFQDGIFAGALVWYSTIHLPAADLRRALAELVRVVRPGGHLLVGFQAGTGSQDLTETYRRLGHEVALVRHRRTADEMATLLLGLGTHEVARLIRSPVGTEVDDQAVLLMRRPAPAPTSRR